LSGAHAVPWHAVVQFHREVTRRAEEAFLALPVTVSATERWSSLTGFEPEQLAGPWEVDFEALASPHLQRDVRTGIGETFIGGPCWFRWKSESKQHRRLEWIPLIYREVRVEDRDDRLRIVPVQDGWDVCPLVIQFLEQRNVQIDAPLDEMLPDLLSAAESKAAEDGHGLTCTLVDAFRLAAPELGEVLVQARDDFPVDQVEFVPSPWVLFTPLAAGSAITQHIVRDYDELERHLAAAPQNIGGLGLLEDAPGSAVQETHEVAPIVPLNDSQRFAVEATLAGRPVTVISGPPGCGKSQVVLSILLDAWASSTSVLFVSNSNQAVDALHQRLKTIESDFDIAVHAGAQQFNNIDEALGRTLDLITARQGESHYGVSPSARKRMQLIKKKQRLRELLDNQVPQRVSQAIEAALKSHVAQRQALSALKSRREELIAKLRSLGVGDKPDSFDERVLDPLRNWRNGINATHRLVGEDAQRGATLQRELSAARADRDSVLVGYQIESRSDQASSWLLAEPGFESFEQALVALSNKLRQPIENGLADVAWEKTYDAWSSSEAAADWERKAREMAALIRPAGIVLKEKAEEVRAAREALDSARRNVQTATKTSSLDIRREYLDEWAGCYRELCALPRSKLAFLPRSRSAELVQQLEQIERRFRSSFPVHLWTSIGELDESGRTRLSAVIERAREWASAREDWERLSPVRDEIEAETDALRRGLVALGTSSLSTEMTPATCAAIASKLREKASVAAMAAAAWSKRENRERLPAELVDLATQIRTAGAGVPIKERWVNGTGAPLIAALDLLASNPEVETIAAVQREVCGSAAADPILQNWRRAYKAEKQGAAIAEEMERIPSRAARLSHWKSRRPTSLPAALEVAGAFDDDDSHPVWVFLQECEEWNQRWATYRDEDAAALERTANAEGAQATQRIGEAAKALPEGEERTWLESFASGSTVSEPWPVGNITEKAALWRPQRLQAEIEGIDAQLERITFESAKEQWLERVARDLEVLRSLDALRDHYRRNRQRIEENGYAHFEQALKAQPVWVTAAMSAQSIPMQPGLFDLLVIDEATQCTLTNMLPLIFRAKRLVVIGDPEQLPSIESLGVEAERTLAARFGGEEWAELLGHVGTDVYKTAVGALPRRQADVISLVEGTDKVTASGRQSLDE
jgi:hypothetical protein